MRIAILPSGTAEAAGLQFLSSYLINESVAIDAGCLGFALSPEQLRNVKHVFLTHTHMDHIASLPMVLDITFANSSECVTLHGSQFVLDVLQNDLFNDRLWPNFVGLSKPQARFCKLSLLEENVPVEVEGLRLTPIPVHHVVPTFGYLVEDEKSAVLFSGDTGPTEAIWQQAQKHEQLRGVFVETTFTSSMVELAKVAQHLTPALLADELKKLDRSVDVVVVHIHPRYRDSVVREIEALELPGVTVGIPGACYEW